MVCNRQWSEQKEKPAVRGSPPNPGLGGLPRHRLPCAAGGLRKLPLFTSLFQGRVPRSLYCSNADQKARPNSFKNFRRTIIMQGAGIEVPRTCPGMRQKASPNASQNLRNLDIVERFALAVPRPRGKPRGTRRARATCFCAAKTVIFL